MLPWRTMPRPLAWSTVSSAWSQGTLRMRMVTLPVTLSAMMMFTLPDVGEEPEDLVDGGVLELEVDALAGVAALPGRARWGGRRWPGRARPSTRGRRRRRRRMVSMRGCAGEEVLLAGHGAVAAGRPAVGGDAGDAGWGASRRRTVRTTLLPSRVTTPAASAVALDLDDHVVRVALAPVRGDGAHRAAEGRGVELALEAVGEAHAAQLDEGAPGLVRLRVLGAPRELDDDAVDAGVVVEAHVVHEDPAPGALRALPGGAAPSRPWARSSRRRRG